MLTFQQVIQKLSTFWEKQGCLIHQGHDLEVGAGTFNPATFLRCLGPEPYKAAYVEPSRRPSDGRYGENPNRLQLFHQLQVIIKPSASNIMELYKESLEAIGIDLSKHDLRFVHDDWESPTLGASGLGWEVWIDGMEVTQFTYFQQVANLPLKPITVELTYGLERLSMYVQNKNNVYDMLWDNTHTYGEICKQNEVEWSGYNFTYASTQMWQRHFDDYETEAKALIAHQLPIPAYDFVMKASHAFNILDARGAISVTERTGYIGRIRDLSRLIANEYLAMREKLGFPLLKDAAIKTPQIPKAKTPIKTFDPHRREEFLFEIGSEQLPATFVPLGMKSLENRLRAFLKEHNLAYESIHPFGTPRRLGALVRGLVEGTSDEVVERKGPRLEAAFDEQGALTKQGAGFFNALGFENVSLQKIKEGAFKGLEVRGDYLYAVIEKKGTSTYTLLADALPSLILQIDFPKKMRWGSVDITYARPIQWIAALYGDEPISFAVGTIASHPHTFGHSQLDDTKIPLPNAASYFSLLKKHKVLADCAERKMMILDQLGQLEKSLGRQALETKKVLAQVVYMTEWPLLTHASFDPHYLTIPPEVLVSEMVEHQRYFPVADEKNTLVNQFIITCDNTPNELIREGNQKVLSARLADGAFLFHQDVKTPLDQFTQKLATMTFQKKLGTMLDKVMRIIELAQTLNDHLKLADQTKLDRAAYICKGDLASQMVKEFPDLQGTIGKRYALKQGEDKEVANAIEEHWMPRTEDGDLPQTPCGIVLSLSDKLDNLTSYFKIGLKPTSSSDPYALRRQTIGIIKILIEQKLSLSLESFLSEEILLFFTNRAKGVLEEMGFAKDEIGASLRGLCTHPYEQYCKVAALHAFRQTPAFDGLFEVYKRAKGQLEKGKAATFNPSLAKETAEKELIAALSTLEKKWDHLLSQKQYSAAFEAMATLQKPLAHLFDTVKILDEDPTLQSNRLALLNKIFSLFDQLLDFSQIQKG